MSDPVTGFFIIFMSGAFTIVMISPQDVFAKIVIGALILISMYVVLLCNKWR